MDSSSATHLPWQVFTDPLTQWHRLPTFVLGEHAILAAAIVALVHARRRGLAHLVVFLAALIAGTANDLVFMALPLVDNFWHGQATWMITPRLPLYIPALYVLFMYYPTVAAARLGLSRLGTAALAGLVAVLTYAPFDIVGAKFLWWTWHDTDVPIAARLLGVPTSSTLWVLTFTGAFAFLVGPVLLSREAPTRRTAALTLLRVAGLTTLAMMPQMSLLQLVDGGRPAYRALATGLVVYAAIAAYALRNGLGPREPDRMPLVGVLLHLGTLALAIAAFDPSNHVSTGIHETVGPCDVTATDLQGNTRRAYLCASDYHEDYELGCTEVPREGSRWYTICGRPFTDRGRYVGVVLALVLAAAAFYLRVFAVGRAPQASA